MPSLVKCAAALGSSANLIRSTISPFSYGIPRKLSLFFIDDDRTGDGSLPGICLDDDDDDENELSSGSGVDG